MPNARNMADIFLPYLNKYMERYGIDNRMRACHFLAQIAHESGELRYTKELASGEAYAARTWATSSPETACATRVVG